MHLVYRKTLKNVACFFWGAYFCVDQEAFIPSWPMLDYG